MRKYVVKEIEGCFGVFIIDNAGIETLIETCNLESNAAVICETFNADLVKDSYGEEMLEHNKKLAEHSQSVDKALDDSCETIRNLKQQLHTTNQETLYFKNKYFAEKQIAIEELEKVKEWFISNSEHDEDHNAILIDYTIPAVVSLIDQQIKELKGKK